jgi:aspartate/methionine/tyrosine aminotransferase
VILNGVAKTYAMTGWRVGWMISPPDVTAAAINLQSHSTSNVSNVAQAAALAAVSAISTRSPRCAMPSLVAGRMMYELLSKIPGVSVLAPEGAFYCFPSFEGVLGREIAGRVPHNTLELCEMLLDVAKVAIVPGEAFGRPDTRVCRLLSATTTWVKASAASPNCSASGERARKVRAGA